MTTATLPETAATPAPASLLGTRGRIVLIAVIAVAEAVTSIGARWLSANIGEGLIFDLRRAVFDHVQKMPVAFFTRTRTGALVSRLNNDVIGAQRAFSDTLSGVVSNFVTLVLTLGVMLAISRAIGETMIVVMAAGAAANLSANPFASMTTVTFQIVALLTGDQDFNTPKTMSAFALGLVLFVVTLLLNIVALRVVKRFREAYD